MKKYWSLILATLLLAGCGHTPSQDANGPIVIQNGERKIELAKPPKRLVTLRQHITETAIAMNLDPFIIGTADVIDPPVAPEYAERYRKLPVIAEKYPSPEVLFAANPDLVWVDRQWAFVKNQMGSLENIENHGVKVYFSESAFHDRSTLDYLYTDIERMGKAFGKPQDAEHVITDMKTRVANVQKKLGHIDHRLRVLAFDTIRGGLPFVGCRSMSDELIRLAGGENIFGDIDKEWTTVSWEEILLRNPEFIIVHEYRGVSGESKIQALLENPRLREVDAIRNHRFVVINLDEVYEGVRNAKTVEKLAKAFYPEKFKDEEK